MILIKRLQNNSDQNVANQAANQPASRSPNRGILAKVDLLRHKKGYTVYLRKPGYQSESEQSGAMTSSRKTFALSVCNELSSRVDHSHCSLEGAFPLFLSFLKE